MEGTYSGIPLFTLKILRTRTQKVGFENGWLPRSNRGRDGGLRLSHFTSTVKRSKANIRFGYERPIEKLLADTQP